MSIIPNFFLDSVVALGVKNVNPINGVKEFFAVGTGFIVFKYTDGEKGFAFIVTNKHVIKEKDIIYIRFDHSDGRKEEIEIKLIDDSGNIIYFVHPNEKIDIAAIYINIDYLRDTQLVHSNFILDKHALKLEQMKSSGISEGSFIYALGFPMNLIDVIKTPICRMGCISRIRDLYKDNKRHSFIIDTQVFPGNSGGPVITRPETISLEGTPVHNRASLIGIVYAYIPYKETLISQQDKQPRSIQQENSGLALVHPTDYIFEVVEGALKKNKLL